MTEKTLNDRYFKWMCRVVYDEQYFKSLSYQKLLTHLHQVPFTYLIELDGNRASDGEDLRYRFGYECGYEPSLISSFLDTQPCSVLEMMIALALRCEEQIMDNSIYGNRTSQWFWNMIVSLGLGRMTNARYDSEYVDDVLERFLNRAYEPNGKGGLFTVEHCRKDMRNIEIWYQMHTYLEDKE